MTSGHDMFREFRNLVLELLKPTVACRPLVTAHYFGAAPAGIIRVAGGVVADLKRA